MTGAVRVCVPRRIEEELFYALGEGCMIHWLWLNGIGFGRMILALVGGFIDSFVVFGYGGSGVDVCIVCLLLWSIVFV